MHKQCRGALNSSVQRYVSLDLKMLLVIVPNVSTGFPLCPCGLPCPASQLHALVLWAEEGGGAGTQKFCLP